MIDIAVIRPRRAFRPSEYRLKIAVSPRELDGFRELRRRVFCDEQSIFDGTDRDAYDEAMIPIVCMAMVMNMDDQVVGAVRLDEREPGVFWGSRLCVERRARSNAKLSSGTVLRNHLPRRWGSIGAGLIYKAVTTAHGLGCHTFLATVQQQNAAFFERLHWKRLGRVELHGLPHVRMQADLDFYPPAREA